MDNPLEKWADVIAIAREWTIEQRQAAQEATIDLAAYAARLQGELAHTRATLETCRQSMAEMQAELDAAKAQRIPEPPITQEANAVAVGSQVRWGIGWVHFISTVLEVLPGGNVVVQYDNDDGDILTTTIGPQQYVLLTGAPEPGEVDGV